MIGTPPSLSESCTSVSVARTMPLCPIRTRVALLPVITLRVPRLSRFHRCFSSTTAASTFVSRSSFSVLSRCPSFPREKRARHPRWTPSAVLGVHEQISSGGFVRCCCCRLGLGIWCNVGRFHLVLGHSLVTPGRLGFVLGSELPLFFQGLVWRPVWHGLVPVCPLGRALPSPQATVLPALLFRCFIRDRKLTTDAFSLLSIYKKGFIS